MDDLMQAVSEHFVAVICGACFLVAIVVKGVVSMMTTASRERSRREIAAYIAEGSINAEHGERLLRADVNRTDHRLG